MGSSVSSNSTSLLFTIPFGENILDVFPRFNRVQRSVSTDYSIEIEEDDDSSIPVEDIVSVIDEFALRLRSCETDSWSCQRRAGFESFRFATTQNKTDPVKKGSKIEGFGYVYEKMSWECRKQYRDCIFKSSLKPL